MLITDGAVTRSKTLQFQKTRKRGIKMKTDTIALLKECDAGAKMAISSIDQVINKIQSTSLFQLLKESKSHHEKLCDEIHHTLNSYQEAEKNPNPIAKVFANIKTSLMTTLEQDDATIAKLMTDGCNMGVKSLSEYLNKYTNADAKSKDYCNRLIAIEDQLAKDLRPHLL